MEEVCEFRVVERFAHLLFDEEEGTKLGSVRKILLAVSDPRFAKVGELQNSLRESRNKSFFHGWGYHRRYSKTELASASAFQLIVPPRYEPTGEECGTEYDESTACTICGAGRRQRSELILDFASLPAHKDIANTIADEIVVSARFASIIKARAATGFILGPVRDRRMKRRSNSSWYQLLSRPPFAKLDERTRTGVGPFNDDPEGRYRCPLGHVAGLNLLSEIWIRRSSWDGLDFGMTQECVGIKRGLLRPRQLLIISPAFWRMLQEEEIRGWESEVVHLV